jgi:hypothetical protein
MPLAAKDRGAAASNSASDHVSAHLCQGTIRAIRSLIPGQSQPVDLFAVRLVDTLPVRIGSCIA